MLIRSMCRIELPVKISACIQCMYEKFNVGSVLLFSFWVTAENSNNRLLMVNSKKYNYFRWNSYISNV